MLRTERTIQGAHLAVAGSQQSLRCGPAISVFLNHFFVTLDAACYAEIARSDFLKTEFAAYEQRVTVSTDRTYTSQYFYGSNTYLQFFEEGPGGGHRTGDSGVGFGVDRAGVIDEVKRSLDAAKIDAEQTTVRRQLEQVNVPWFLKLSCGGFPPNSVVATWVMEYHERFLGEWHADAGPRDGGVSRRQIIDRYRAVLEDRPMKPILEDVVSLTIAVDSRTNKALTALCKLWGYDVYQEEDTVALGGPDVVIRLVPEGAGRRGIVNAGFTCNRTPSSRELRFGRSVLLFANGIASWTF